MRDKEELRKVLEPVLQLATGSAHPAKLRSAITPELIEALSTTIFSKLFDDPVPHADFHRELWKVALSASRKKAIAAPRGHAKSTCISLVFVLVCICFRLEEFIVIISNTEEQAAKFIKTLTNGVKELKELGIFGVVPKPTKSNETELEIQYTDGSRFYIKARGFNQEIRGFNWNNRRPGLIICDDMEDTETCDSDVQRDKAKRRFTADVLPALSRKGKIIVIGTILHFDSILMNLIENKSWESRIYEACDADFENVLWPEYRDQEYLIGEYESFKSLGNVEEFNREYRNKPVVAGQEYFLIRNLVEWEWDEKTDPLSCYYKLMVVDPAVTANNKADDTAIAVFGIDAEDEIHLLELFAEKIDAIDLEGIIFAMRKRWSPEEIVMEKGIIKSAVLPFMEREMQRNNDWFDIEGIHAHADKIVRAKPMQARMKFQQIYVNNKIDHRTKKKMYQQLTNFPKYKDDDIVDVFAYFGIRQNEIIQGRTKAEVEEFEFQEAVSIFEEIYGDFDADPDTGY